MLKEGLKVVIKEDSYHMRCEISSTWKLKKQQYIVSTLKLKKLSNRKNRNRIEKKRMMS